MSVKTTGAEYKAYLNDTDPQFWPEGAWMDDEVLLVNGKEVGEDNFDFDYMKLNDADSVILECGSYYKSVADRDPIELVTHFKRWRKAQTTAYISVSVDKTRIDELKAMLKTFGAKIA